LSSGVFSCCLPPRFRIFHIPPPPILGPDLLSLAEQHPSHSESSSHGRPFFSCVGRRFCFFEKRNYTRVFYTLMTFLLRGCSSPADLRSGLQYYYPLPIMDREKMESSWALRRPSMFLTLRFVPQLLASFPLPLFLFMGIGPCRHLISSSQVVAYALASYLKGSPVRPLKTKTFQLLSGIVPMRHI